MINDEQTYCTANALNFIDFPQKIMAGNKTVLSHHILHHFSSCLDFMNQDFRSVSLFRNTAQNDPTIGQDIVTFFESAKQIQYGLIITAVCMILLVILLS